MGLLERGNRFLASTFKTHESTEVRYRREGTWLDLSATLGTRLLQQETTNAAQLVFGSADWIFVASDLEKDDERFEPERGDLIAVVMEDQTVTHEVCDETGGGKCFEYDAYRTTVRVHTKITGAGSTP